MRKVNKEKKKTEISKKDLHTEDENSPLYTFNRMAYTPIYEYRIRKHLYEQGLISPKGFLFNGDILSLPGIAKKNKKGEVMLADFIIVLLNRFQMSEEIFKSGNSLLATLLDFDDYLYDVILNTKNKEDVFSDPKVVSEVNKAYDRVTNHILDMKINSYIADKEEFMEFFKK